MDSMKITIRSSCNGEWSTILHDVHASDFDWNAAAAGVLRDALRALGFEGATAEDIHLVASGQLLPQDAESLARVLRDLAWVQWNQQQAHLGAAEALNKQGKADVSAGDLESAATRFTEAVDRACKAGAPASGVWQAALANLSSVRLQQERPEDAVSLCDRLLRPGGPSPSPGSSSSGPTSDGGASTTSAPSTPPRSRMSSRRIKQVQAAPDSCQLPKPASPLVKTHFRRAQALGACGRFGAAQTDLALLEAWEPENSRVRKLRADLAMAAAAAKARGEVEEPVQQEEAGEAEPQQKDESGRGPATKAAKISKGVFGVGGRARKSLGAVPSEEPFEGVQLSAHLIVRSSSTAKVTFRVRTTRSPSEGQGEAGQRAPNFVQVQVDAGAGLDQLQAAIVEAGAAPFLSGGASFSTSGSSGKRKCPKAKLGEGLRLVVKGKVLDSSCLMGDIAGIPVQAQSSSSSSSSSGGGSGSSVASKVKANLKAPVVVVLPPALRMGRHVRVQVSMAHMAGFRVTDLRFEVAADTPMPMIKYLLYRQYNILQPSDFELYCAARRVPLTGGLEDFPRMQITVPSSPTDPIIAQAAAVTAVGEAGPGRETKAQDVGAMAVAAAGHLRAQGTGTYAPPSATNDLHVLLVPTVALDLGVDGRVFNVTTQAAFDRFFPPTETSKKALSKSSQSTKKSSTPLSSGFLSSNSCNATDSSESSKGHGSSNKSSKTSKSANNASRGPRPSRSNVHTPDKLLDKSSRSKAKGTFAGLKRGFFTKSTAGLKKRSPRKLYTHQDLPADTPEKVKAAPVDVTGAADVAGAVDAASRLKMALEGADSTLPPSNISSPCSSTDVPPTTPSAVPSTSISANELGNSSSPPASSPETSAQQTPALSKSSAAHDEAASSPSSVAQVPSPSAVPPPLTPAADSKSATTTKCKDAQADRATPGATSMTAALCTPCSGSGSGNGDSTRSTRSSGSSSAKGPRCGVCSRRLKPWAVASGTCRCGSCFCSKHLHFTDHACSFDFRTHERDALKRAAPELSAIKLDRL